MCTSRRHRVGPGLRLGLALGALVLGSAPPVLAQSGDAGNGQLDESFLVTPIAPCRVLDTRLASGILPNNSTRSFSRYRGGTGPSQGGLNCGLTSRTRAVHLNVAALSMTGGAAPGFLTVFPYDAPQPNSSVMNFVAGDTVANAFTVLICANCNSAT